VEVGRNWAGGAALVRSSSTATSSKSSMFIAVAVTIAMLYFGRQLFIPLALALVLSFLLSPLVGLLEKIRLARVPSVIVVLALCFALTLAVGWEVAGQLLEITSHMGDYKANLAEKVQELHAPKKGALGQATATVRQLNKELAAASTEAAAKSASGPNNPTRPTHPIPVQVTPPPSDFVQDLRTLAGPLAGPLETTGIVVIFTAFMLIKREDLRNRLIRLGGDGRLTVMTQALDDASQRLSRYLVLQFLVNAGYGTLFGVGLYFLKVPHPLLWGALAALLRFVPYVGTLIAAAFPFAMGAAVFPGWRHALLILALFMLLELLVANAIEPWLYGAHTGISSLAILVAAIFWTTLWGPVGLILSTPLTVCLMLVGRYVPKLSFLEVLLGDAPVLSLQELFYQRLLAMDQDEARNIAESELREKSLESLYETVLIPALKLAEEDRHMDALGERTVEFICQTTRELIDDLGDRLVEQNAKEGGAQDSNAQVARRFLKTDIVCIPARDEADELVGMMFSQLLRQAGYSATALAIGTVNDMLEQVARGGFRVACVSALPPFAVGQARSLCKRLHARFPELDIVVGLWEFAGGVPKAQERVGETCAAAVATTLPEALLQIRRLNETSERGRLPQTLANNGLRPGARSMQNESAVSEIE
jgi:predicted PurR-regulated permease PerM